MQYLIDVAENGVCVKTFEDNSESECYDSSFVFTDYDSFFDYLAEALADVLGDGDDEEEDEDEDDE